MATLAEVKARIADEVFRFDLDTQIARYIDAAIRQYEKVAFWFNEGEQVVGYTGGSPYVTLPTGTQSLSRVFDLSQGIDLWERGAPELATWAAQGSIPTQLTDYAWEGEGLRLYGTPALSGDLTLHGFFSAAPLDDADENGWTTHGLDVLVSRAKLMLCRAVTLDALRAEAAKRELFGDPSTGEQGYEKALLSENRRRLNLSAPRVRGYY